MSSNRFLTASMLAVLAVAWLTPASISAQTTAGSAKPKPAATYSVPRTPWGDPDLQGKWSHNDPTPLETPDPDPVARAAAAKALASRYGTTANSETGAREGVIFGGAGDRGRPRSEQRRSMVVDPTDGRIPILPGKLELWSLRPHGDHWTNHGAWSRCITRGVPNGYHAGSGFQILQSPGWVVMFPEMIHDARFIPLDGRPHVGKGVQLWNGDSRGRWEGDTLVIETTNFNNKGLVIQDAGFQIRQTEGLRVVERWTRTSEKIIQHRITMEDTNTFTRPWTIELPHNLDPTYTIYEYACHEFNQNYMEGSLRQGRLRDADEAAGKK